MKKTKKIRAQWDFVFNDTFPKHSTSCRVIVLSYAEAAHLLITRENSMCAVEFMESLYRGVVSGICFYFTVVGINLSKVELVLLSCVKGTTVLS